MKLVEYVRRNVGRSSCDHQAEEEQVYQILKKEPMLTQSQIAKKAGLKPYIVQNRLQSLAKKNRMVYVRMWVPMDEIDG
jgi:DNA-binding MarR family transcriptional regulator